MGAYLIKGKEQKRRKTDYTGYREQEIMINFNAENTTLENVVNAVQEYLESAFIDNWMASNIITELDGIYIIPCDSADFVCYMDGDDELETISDFIVWEGEILEKVYHGDKLRNTNTYRDNVSKLMSMIRAENENVLETVLELIKQDSIRKYYSILGY